MGTYVKFTKITHQIWSCHVTLASNSENFYFLPNSILNFRKSYQILGKLVQEHKVTGKNKLGVGNNTPPPPPPVLIGLRNSYKKLSGSTFRKICSKKCLSVTKYSTKFVRDCSLNKPRNRRKYQSNAAMIKLLRKLKTTTKS